MVHYNNGTINELSPKTFSQVFTVCPHLLNSPENLGFINTAQQDKTEVLNWRTGQTRVQNSARTETVETHLKMFVPKIFGCKNKVTVQKWYIQMDITKTHHPILTIRGDRKGERFYCVLYFLPIGLPVKIS